MRALLLAALLAGPAWAWADAGHGAPDGHVHYWAVQDEDPPDPGPEPPDPPDPPDPGYEARCQQGRTGCQPFATLESAVLADVNSTSVPNSPSRPETNSKCPWNKGDQFCAGWLFEGDCSDRPAVRGNVDHDMSKGYSPCYDPAHGALRANYWADRGSSIVHANALERDPTRSIAEDEDPFRAIWMQFELKMSEELFRTPSGSSTAKLARLYWDRDQDPCTLKHLYSHRWGFSATEIWFGYVSACEGNDIYPRSMADRPKVPRADAGKWVRVTAALDFVERTHYLEVTRVSDGHSYGSYTQDMNERAAVTVFPTQWLLPFVHSTQHEPEPGCGDWRGPQAPACGPNPEFWVRHVIISETEIAP